MRLLAAFLVLLPILAGCASPEPEPADRLASSTSPSIHPWPPSALADAPAIDLADLSTPLNVTPLVRLEAGQRAIASLHDRTGAVAFDLALAPSEGPTNASRRMLLAAAFTKGTEIITDGSSGWFAARILYRTQNELEYTTAIQSIDTGQMQFAIEEPAWASTIQSSTSADDMPTVKDANQLVLVVAYKMPAQADSLVLAIAEADVGSRDVPIEQAREQLRAARLGGVLRTLATTSEAELAYYARNAFQPARLPLAKYSIELKDDALVSVDPRLPTVGRVVAACVPQQTSPGWGETTLRVGGIQAGEWNFTIVEDGRERSGAAERPINEELAPLMLYQVRRATGDYELCLELRLKATAVTEAPINGSTGEEQWIFYSLQTGLRLESLGLGFDETLRYG